MDLFFSPFSLVTSLPVICPLSGLTSFPVASWTKSLWAWRFPSHFKVSQCDQGQHVAFTLEPPMLGSVNDGRHLFGRRAGPL